MKRLFNPNEPKLEPRHHPELQQGEVFLTNTSEGDEPLSGWAGELKTARRGTVAYGRDDKVVPHCVPVFILRSELEAKGIDADDPFGFRRSRIRHEKWIAELGREGPLMWQECDNFIPEIRSYIAEGLPDDVVDHLESCTYCHAFLVASGHTVEELRAIWRAKEPERKAREKFYKDCNDWYKTWKGTIYLYFGGPFWSRRAKWLGIPRWEDYAPK